MLATPPPGFSETAADPVECLRALMAFTLKSCNPAVLNCLWATSIAVVAIDRCRNQEILFCQCVLSQ